MTMTNTHITRQALEAARAYLLNLSSRLIKYRLDNDIDTSDPMQASALALYRRAESELNEDKPEAIATITDLISVISGLIDGREWPEPEALEVLAVWLDEPEYDPDKSHDGGSYYQPTIIVYFSDGVVIRIDDASCGDFGSRIYADIIVPDGTTITAHWGSMEPDNEWTTIDDGVWGDHIALTAEVTGYGLYTIQQQAAYKAEDAADPELDLVSDK